MIAICEVLACENEGKTKYWIKQKVRKIVCEKHLKTLWKENQTNFKNIPWINENSISSAEPLKNDDDIKWD